MPNRVLLVPWTHAGRGWNYAGTCSGLMLYVIARFVRWLFADWYVFLLFLA